MPQRPHSPARVPKHLSAALAPPPFVAGFEECWWSLIADVAAAYSPQAAQDWLLIGEAVSTCFRISLERSASRPRSP